MSKVKDYSYILKALLVKLQNENPKEEINLIIYYNSIGLDKQWIYALNKVELQNENIDSKQKEVVAKLSNKHFKDKLFNLNTLADLVLNSGYSIGHDRQDLENPHINIIGQRIFDKKITRK